MKIRVFDILWDFDKGCPKRPQSGKALISRNLESSYCLEWNSDESVDDLNNNGELADALSDATGYCVFAFSYEVVSE